MRCQRCESTIDVMREQYIEIVNNPEPAGTDAERFTVCSWSCLAAEARKRGNDALHARMKASDDRIAELKRLGA